MDLTDINVITPFKENLDNWFNEHLIDQSQVPDGSLAVKNPANHKEIIGHVKLQSGDEMKTLLANAEAAFESWSQTPVKDRANLLRRIADILERHHDELVAICIKEAGKVAQDGIDEVREAVDFCRYYAARAEELSEDERFEARGVILCISPWNFPLAIFLGQVAAAIVTGNTVIAKPAEQTSLIALRAIELMTSVGLPHGVVQAVIARGSDVGSVIIPNARVQAVIFTGSIKTATIISQTLADRGGDQVPFIAETGGQNCMLVDSTALPEQVVDDAIESGFNGAGQRCSALRILAIQEEVYDKTIKMLSGATQKIKIGLLVPLTGKDSQIGNSIVKSIRLAINKIDNPLIEIIPKDTESNPEITLKKAKELNSEGVKIVIGPVFNKNLVYLNEIENMIQEAIPGSIVVIEDLRGDGDHYSAHVKSELFNGK
jgi:RHH-type proline utilization regulon transcriptional repressor/proline dehydrogenase/delta 1-pyrroline-5-carboxylate dehydrogenase